MISFRPISPCCTKIDDRVDSEAIDSLNGWLFSVSVNARNSSSENITALQDLAGKLPDITVLRASPTLVKKIETVFESIARLAQDPDLLKKVKEARRAVTNAFPKGIQAESPVSTNKHLCFSPDLLETISEYPKE